MDISSVIKAGLYLGVILLLFLVVISFNSLQEVSVQGTKTIRAAQDRFRLDIFESEIKNTLIESTKDNGFTKLEIRHIDEQFAIFEQQLEGLKLPELQVLKKKWSELKDQTSPDIREITHAFDLLHIAINKIFLTNITKRHAITEKDITDLKIMKIVIGIFIFTMVLFAFYLDTQQTKQKNELVKRLTEIEKRTMRSESNYISAETLRNLVDSIGHEGMTRIVQSFLIELPKDEESINQFLSEKNLNEIHKIGHRNISSSQAVGAEGLAELFKQLEEVDQIERAIELNSKINQEAKVVMSKLQDQITH